MKDKITHKVVTRTGMNIKTTGVESYGKGIAMREEILSEAPVVACPREGVLRISGLSYSQTLTLERRLKEELTPSIEIVLITAANGTAEPEQDMKGKRIRKGVVVEERST